MPAGFGTWVSAGFKFPMLAMKIYLIWMLRKYEVVIDKSGLERKFTSICRANNQLDFAVRERKDDEFVRIQWMSECNYRVGKFIGICGLKL